MSANSDPAETPGKTDHGLLAERQAAPETLTKHELDVPHRRGYLVLLPLLVLLVLWFWAFFGESAAVKGPNGKNFEGDFAMFASAAQLLHQGQNPYDTHLLERQERATMARDQLPVTREPGNIRVGNPPLLFWAIQPLNQLSYQPAALIWGGLMLALTVAGFVAATLFAGWSRRGIALVFFLLMPEAYFAAFYGNVVPLVFAGIALALACLRRRPALAGCLLSVTLLKPPVSLFVVLLVLLFYPRQRVRVLQGFGVTLIVLLVLTLATSGGQSVLWWLHALVAYTSNSQNTPDAASLTGLYLRWAPGGLRLALEVLSALTALALTYYYWKRNAGRSEPPALTLATLWMVWFLAAPYAHFYDTLLLAVPIVLLLGKNGYRATWRLPVWSLYLLFLASLLVSAQPFHVLVLPLPLLIIAWLIFRADCNPRYPEAAYVAH